MPEVTDLLKLHGVDAYKAVSKGGRVELQLRSTPVYESALYRLMERTKPKLLIYDSVSAPLKSTFPSTQDLPARSSSLAMLLSHAQRLCIEFGISVLTTSHVSIDPINAWDRQPYGGIILGHDAKFSFELTKPKRRGTRTPTRSPSTPRTGTRTRTTGGRSGPRGILPWQTIPASGTRDSMRRGSTELGIGKKILLLIVGLMLLGLGAWIITALIFAYLFIPPMLRLARRPEAPAVAHGHPARQRRSISAFRILGAFLLALSLIALGNGGTFSPLVFGGAGLILLFKPPHTMSFSRLFGGFKSAENSILLRGRIIPFRWLALAEAKVSTREVEGALSGMKERLLLISSPNPRMFVVLLRFVAWQEKGRSEI